MPDHYCLYGESGLIILWPYVELFILVVFCCLHSGGICRWYPCKPRICPRYSHHVAHSSRRTSPRLLFMARCSSPLPWWDYPVSCYYHLWLMRPFQTWLIGNTVADLMITAAMIYHVRTARLHIVQKKFES